MELKTEKATAGNKTWKQALVFMGVYLDRSEPGAWSI
jgi:hypothetical protein